ncbi:MAG TPA: DoxX family protein [Pyrinomonadaceae bacterium]|jgi:hypothetical protein|nr:DoxX family protein [Pyrinomonadaceae bacterium]
MADTQISRAAHWTGLIVGGLPALFLIVDGVMKLFKPEFVVKATTDLGYSENVIIPLGVVLLTCVALFMIPKTTVLGAILITGYLGGAVATHVQHRDGAFEIVLPVIFGVMIWLGLWLCDTRMRQLVPIRS